MAIATRMLFLTLLLLCVVKVGAFSKEGALEACPDIGSAEFPVESGGYLFFNCNWEASADASQEEQEAGQLEAQFEEVGRYVCAGLQELRVQQSPFGEKLSRLILPPCDFKLPEIAMITVREEERSEEHLCVFACNPAEIEEAKASLRKEAKQLKNFTEQQWAVLLKKAFDDLEREVDRRSFLTLLGCPIVMFLNEREIRYMGVNFDKQSETAWKEIRELLSWVPDDGSYFLLRKGSPVWEWVWATKGNVDFSDAPQKDNGEFDEGKNLYHQGKDIPRIMDLFGRSIELAPNGQEKWRYLGGILRVKKQYRDSLVAYMQAAKMDNLPSQDLNTIQQLCDACGMTTNAAGLRWYLLMLDVQSVRNIH